MNVGCCVNGCQCCVNVGCVNVVSMDVNVVSMDVGCCVNECWMLSVNVGSTVNPFSQHDQQSVLTRIH